MKRFQQMYDGKTIEDDGCYMSDEAKKFVTAFRSMLKRMLPDCKVTIKAGHYDLYGFVSRNGYTEYISYSIPRYRQPIRFDETGAMNGVLYRSAKDVHDFHGGQNHFCSILDLPAAVETALEWQEKHN